MPDKKALAKMNAADPTPAPVPRRALSWTRRAWRPAVSGLLVALALLLGWHVVKGKNGLSAWQQKRAEDRQLHKEIDDLNQENARLRERIERLKSNPDAIGIVAHDKLHYTKPNEVIIQLPPEKQSQPASAGK